MRACSILVAVGLLCFSSTAHGHAIVLSATPGPHQVIGGPDILVKLRFNSRIDARRSRLILVSSDGEQRSLAITDSKSPDALQSQASGLKSGSYVIRWQVLAADGHITRGEVPFSVHAE